MAAPYWPVTGVPYQLLDYVSSTQALSLVPGGNTVFLNVSGGGGGGFNPDPQFSTITVAGQTTLQGDLVAGPVFAGSVTIPDTGYVQQYLDAGQTSTVKIVYGNVNVAGNPTVPGLNVTTTEGGPPAWDDINVGQLNLAGSYNTGSENGVQLTCDLSGNTIIYAPTSGPTPPTLSINGTQYMTLKQNLGLLNGTAPANGTPSTIVEFSTIQDHLYRLTIPLTAGTTDGLGVTLIGPTNALNANKCFLANLYSQAAYGNNHSCPSVMWIHNVGTGTAITAYQVGNAGTSDVSITGSGAAILEDLGIASVL